MTATMKKTKKITIPAMAKRFLRNSPQDSCKRVLRARGKPPALGSRSLRQGGVSVRVAVFHNRIRGSTTM